jgi:hypothetical protein
MARLITNRVFLEELILSTGKARKKIITNCSDEFLKCLFEIIYNSVKLAYTTKEKKEFNKCIKFVKALYSQKWNLEEFKVFLLKNALKLQILCVLVFSKYVEGKICEAIQNVEFENT